MGCDSFSLNKKDNQQIVSGKIPKSPVNITCTSTEPVIEKEEDQLNHLRWKFSNHKAQFAVLKSFMMDALWEFKNKIKSLIQKQKLLYKFKG